MINHSSFFIKKFLILFFVIFTGSTVRSYELGQNYTELTGIKEDFVYSHFYFIQESQRSKNINLIRFKKIEKQFPLPEAAYNRLLHFKGWINPKNDDSCLNIRSIVLVRDADDHVTYSANGCSVQEAAWDDPYSAKSFSSPQDIHVDHFVPLKNAYMTGASEWNAKKRCLYANYIGNDFHLLAVSAKENMTKRDSSPLRYLPLNKAYVCQYLKQWLSVKVIWNLRLTPRETEAIKKEIDINRCDKNTFTMTNSELAAQRRYMEDNKDFCD